MKLGTSVKESAIATAHDVPVLINDNLKIYDLETDIYLKLVQHRLFNQWKQLGLGTYSSPVEYL